jgi:hypothetical protein
MTLTPEHACTELYYNFKGLEHFFVRFFVYVGHQAQIWEAIMARTVKHQSPVDMPHAHRPKHTKASVEPVDEQQFTPVQSPANTLQDHLSNAMAPVPHPERERWSLGRSFRLVLMSCALFWYSLFLISSVVF